MHNSACGSVSHSYLQPALQEKSNQLGIKATDSEGGPTMKESRKGIRTECGE